MTTMKDWLKAVVFDGAVCLCFYLWLVLGIDGAENVLKFVFWFVSISLMIVAVGKIPMARPKKSAAKNFFDTTTAIAYVLLWAYIGCFVIAAFYALAIVAITSHRDNLSKVGTPTTGEAK